ncbi:MAG TPA: hypothetical protein VEW28_06905 [Candidatus Kapabacteria bacterium]|nr:hypothetical protein [Candidatus Kapabacteria bacterium]
MRLRYKTAVAVLLIISGCSSSDITSPDQIVFPVTGVSFKAQVEPLFSLSCNVTGCHDQARSDNNMVDLTTWGNVRSLNVVDQPGDTNCGMLRVVFGRELHPGPLKVNDNHKQGLRQWVIEGAQNN